MASFLSSFLPSCLPCLLLLLQLSSSYAGQFRVIGPGHPIRALVGDEVELPCRIFPGRNATGMEVGWYRPPFSRVVHLYRNGKDQDGEQAPEYRSRTELLKETIGEGKVTLRIKNVRFSDEGGFTCFFRDHSYQEEAAMELKVEAPSTVQGVEDTVLGLPVLVSDPFYWINPGVLVVIAVLPVLLLQIAVGLVFLCLQHRLRGKLRAEIENLHRTFDPHFLRVPCWKITLFVIVPVLGPLVALIICYNWLHRRLAGQFLEELSKFSPANKEQNTRKAARERGGY
ncbi:myelin-oligodendrocyte glycoprotein isoform X1 [Pteropus medius]|uniref:Myelin-oligodendrocyte glycoprotein n=1 Tax=Pteropus vampyrus TaxID=132908 RepID=A0A6P6C1G1_PTEVA|nr:myelin-oligodendrocyte glycoprotein isoform X1 [Pteropus vampyrus]XP_039707057.1 myelin-oligodendrocyte glycoprotein isoform X1 [Pteropus giganteus]